MPLWSANNPLSYFPKLYRQLHSPRQGRWLWLSASKIAPISRLLAFSHLGNSLSHCRRVGLWLIVLPEVTACHFPDEVTKDRDFHLGCALSLITCSGGSQLPGLEVTEAALWRDPGCEDLKSSVQRPVRNGGVPATTWVPQPPMYLREDCSPS